jgi:hypothetical protein
MQGYHPDRVVRVLNTLVSFAYFAVWVAAVVVLVAAPVARLLSTGQPDGWTWSLEVPATLTHAQSSVQTSWGQARLVVEDVRGMLRLPIATLPWWLVGVLWTHVAIVLALTLASLHHLRRIFRRVRDGAPFDADNALRLRWLGLLLLALTLFDGVAQLVTSLAVRGGLAAGSVAVTPGLRVDLPLVFVALALIALAEVFRRGAELEREQSLVI